MSDIFDSEKRSAIMSKVRSKGNKTTELRLIKYFKENGIHGWRRDYKVKGHPDFVFLKQKIAIFVDGCFWHGHDCRNTRPSDNAEFWQKKRERNMLHDKEITELFEARGWTVIRIWECELKKAILPETMNRIINELEKKKYVEQ
ncbi:MAG: DNA mismatch endonuclease Vsr [Clostridia bacterium]|nr:DNA mismatch endonuclease Vsr [Clostridia bacterium]